jgi:hypothetical protein
LKTLFAQRQSDESFTDPASTVELQSMNLWLLKTATKYEKVWCDNNETWTSDDCEYVIWSDELFFTLFPTSGRIYVWKTPKETRNPEFLVPLMNTEADLWWFGQQYLGILLVL